MGNASHLLKCENTNKLKSVKGEKNCFIVGNDPVSWTINVFTY